MDLFFSALIGGIVSGCFAIWGAKMTLDHHRKIETKTKVVKLNNIFTEMIKLETYMIGYMKYETVPEDHPNLQLDIDKYLHDYLGGWMKEAILVDIESYEVLDILLSIQLQLPNLFSLRALKQGEAELEDIEVYMTELYYAAIKIQQRSDFYVKKIRNERPK